MSHSVNDKTRISLVLLDLFVETLDIYSIVLL